MSSRRVSRKFYTLMLNRAVADLGIAVSFTVVVMSAHQPVNGGQQVLFTLIFYSSIYATTITYVSLLLIKLASITRPLQMRGGVRLRTCVRLIVFR